MRGLGVVGEEGGYDLPCWSSGRSFEVALLDRALWIRHPGSLTCSLLNITLSGGNRQDLVEVHDTNALKDIIVDHNVDNDKATNTIAITGPGDRERLWIRLVLAGETLPTISSMVSILPLNATCRSSICYSLKR